MALAAEDFEDLIESMGLAGTAADDLNKLLAQLQSQTEAAAAATRAAAAAEKVAAATGTTAAEVKRALAAAQAEAAAAAKAASAAEQAAAREAAAAAKEAAREAAAAARHAASEQAAAARETAAAARQAAAEQKAAAREAAAAAKEAAAERKAADEALMVDSLRMMKARDDAHAQAIAKQKAGDEAIMAESLRMLGVHDERLAAEKAAGEQAAETSKWFSDLSAAGAEQTSMLERASMAWEAYGPYIEIAGAVIQRVVGKLWELGKAAVQFTQEDDALRSALGALAGGGDEAGQAVMDLIDGLGDLPFAAGALEGWAKTLLAAGVQGEKLETSLRAVAASTAIMGQSGAQNAQELIKRFHMAAEAGEKIQLDRRILKQLAQAGVTVADLAKELGVPAEKLASMRLDADKLGAAMQNALIAKGAVPLQRMGQTWDSIRAKVVDAYEDAFANLGDLVHPFMAQLASLGGEFFKGGAASTGFAGVVRGILTPAFEIATRTVRAAHIAYLELLIMYLRIAIAIRPVTSALDKLGVSSGIVNVAMYLIAGTAIMVAAAIGLVALAVGLVVLPFVLAAVAVYALVSAIQYLIANAGAIASGAIAALSGLATGAAEAAAGFVMGLVDGISSGAGAVANAVKNLAQGALSSFTSFFGIASPSKVLRKHARDDMAVGGIAGGLDEGADEVDRAMTDLVEPPEAGGRGGRRGGRGRGDRVFSPTFSNCMFGGDITEDKLRDWLDSWWEEQADSGPEPEAA